MPAYSRILLPWDSQPQDPVEVDWSNPLARGLEFLAPLSLASGFRDIVRGGVATRTGTLAPAANAYGVFPSFGASNYLDFPTVPPNITTTTPATVAWTQEYRSSASDNTVLQINFGTAGTTNPFLIYQGTSATYYFTAGPTRPAGAHQWNVIGAPVNNRRDSYVLVANGGFNSLTSADWVLYRNGVLVTQSGASNYTSSTNGGFRVGTSLSTTAPFEGLIGDLHFWSRPLTADEAAVWGRNVNTLYAPRSIWVPVSAGGGGTTISGALGTATASGFTATIGANRLLSGALGTATASGFQGTVSNSTDTTITGALGTAVASGLAGTVTNGTPTTITGALGTAVASGFTGTVTWDRYVAGVLGVATASGFTGGVANGTSPPTPETFGGGGGSSRTVPLTDKSRLALHKLLDRAFAKQEDPEVIVEALLPAAPEPEQVAAVLRAVLEHTVDAPTRKIQQQAARLVAELKQRKADLEEEEAVVMLLLS